jgi:hypothetical protein
MTPSLWLLISLTKHYEKMGWFAIGLVIGFLSCNDHLQLIVTQHIFMGMNVIRQVAWIAIDLNSSYMKSYTYAIHAT